MKALITGATSGIGKAIAQEMSRRGISLILTGRNEEALLRMQETLPVHTEIIALDLAENQAPFTLYEFCRDKHVDILVNNAGFGVFGKFSENAEAGIVDQNVYVLVPAKFIQCKGCLIFRKIQCNDLGVHRQGFLHAEQGFFVASGQDQRDAAAAHFLCNGFSDAGGCSGDECFHRKNSFLRIGKRFSVWAIPHKERLATLHAICLQISRHISQKCS